MARVCFGALGLTWTWVTGIVGTLLAGMWAFTDHVIARRNENVAVQRIGARPRDPVDPSAAREELARSVGTRSPR
jgi:hypothetical protein